MQYNYTVLADKDDRYYLLQFGSKLISESVPYMSQNLLISPVLVGRDPELAGLTAFLGLASKKESQVALVTSEVRVGKTRLINAFRNTAQYTYFSARTSSSVNFELLAYTPRSEAIARITSKST